jgi:hypothetical protein
MSHDDRDQGGGHPIRHHSQLDCLCCPTTMKQDARPARRVDRSRAIAEQLERGRWDLDLGDLEDDEPIVVLHDGGHIFEAERCVYCNVNYLDIGIYPDAPEICPIPREPLNYSTETGQGPSASDPRLLEPDAWLHDTDW